MHNALFICHNVQVSVVVLVYYIHKTKTKTKTKTETGREKDRERVAKVIQICKPPFFVYNNVQMGTMAPVNQN